ncbi:MAG: hypothetical protein OJF55_001462 [Rhodanobacteraceae bacterium]|nr:MAG: hypothetical protein OJF55_001462 [Rhodanobacteraceae bacterium]
MSPSELAVVVQAIGWGLVHFVWQAALVGVLYAVARALLPRGNQRYVAAMLALVALAIIPACTAWHEVQSLAQPVELGNVWVTAATGASASATTPASVGWLAELSAALPWLVLGWAGGVVFLGMRVVRQWRGLRAIVRAAETLPVWQDRARRLGERLGLKRAVRVLASVRIATPTLVGWARPVVVMPLAMLARMPAEQVDLILAHELAHVRRFDHIANLFQVMVETLLFYHPVVHWISRDARNERELCCDALALQASGGRRRDFVAALAGLEEFRAGHADLALAASGGVLVERAWFIAGTAQPRPRPHFSLGVALLALLGVAVVSTLAWQQNVEHARIDAALAANAEAIARQWLATAAVPSPAWRTVPAARPTLAPLAPARETAPQAAAMPASVVPARMPALSVANLVLTPAPLDAVVRPTPASVGTPPDSALAAAPRPLRSVAPAYPPQALLNGAQGQVEIQFSLDAAGVPQNLQVTRSTGSGLFDAAALSALSRWRFTPPAEAGRHYRQTFTFQLGGAVDGSDAAVAQPCLIRTGTHICRPVLDGAPGIGTPRLNH